MTEHSRLRARGAVAAVIALSLSGAAAANDCELFRDDDQIRLESLMKARQLPEALDLGKNLYRHYDECAKATSTDAESRFMNRAWRGDAAVLVAQVYRRTNRAQEARQWLTGACKDYRVVVEATIVDTTTRKMANQAIEKNCRR